MFKKMTLKKKRVMLCAAIALCVLIVWTAWGNTALELNTYHVSSSDLPGSFEGYRIAHVSDLHNAEFGDGNERLLTMLRSAEPDLIAITGDMIDSRRTDVEIALDFAEKAMQIAPCYYVTGNHESRVPEYKELKSGLETVGVIVLENERVTLSIGEETITVLGMNDPNFPMPLVDDVMSTNVQNLLNSFWVEEGYTVLLSHRPELFDCYVKCGANLVLSGHAHGGQFRIPLVGGVIAPNQGLFPEYDSGLYTEGSTNMIVSRGIGNSLFPFRFNNRPEVILIELVSLKG